FQRSADTISKVFHCILNLLITPAFYNCYVKLPPHDTTPPKISENPKLYPFLQDCQGALDGSHL
ncbi:hypothetical protein P691DRAFT_645841, partial [Macrolepiota fuliginosa MF-IS2]